MRNLLTRISAVPSSSNSRIEIPLSLATATGKSSVQGVAVTEELVERTPHPALSIRASVGTFWRQGGWGLDPGPMDRWNIDARSPLRACCTISIRAFLASAGLLTSRKNAMRAPRIPPWGIQAHMKTEAVHS